MQERPKLSPPLAKMPEDHPGSPARESRDLIAVGRIVKAHGLRGQLRVFPVTDSLERFKTLRSVYVEMRDGSSVRYDVEKVKPEQEFVFIRLSGIEDRTAAESLIGLWMSVRRDEVAPLEEDRYYSFDLVGLSVVQEGNGVVGKIVRVEPFPANDVLIVESETEEIWIPALKDILRSVDFDAGVMTVNLPEGLPTYPKREG